MRYGLEIYEAGTKEPLEAFESDTPLIAFQVGDLIHTAGIDPHAKPGDQLRVTRTEHVLVSTGNSSDGKPARLASQKLMVFTDRP